MGMKNTKDSYGTITKIFHWTIALTVYFMLTLGYFLDSIKPASLQDQAYNLHKSIGLTILALIIFRFIWRLNNPSPIPPKTMPTWQRIVSKAVHYLLYASLLMMPLSGLTMESASGYASSFFGLFSVRMPWIGTDKIIADQANQIHKVAAIVIISLIVLHVLAALKHHFIDKDGVLKRMLPFVKTKSTETK